jgi:hypothetical protein
VSAKLSGFDITASNYPAPEWLPRNVSMHVMDAFTPDLPEHLVGSFDIVHIRAIASAVKDNAVEPLLKNMVKMLSMTPPSLYDSLQNNISEGALWRHWRVDVQETTQLPFLS